MKKVIQYQIQFLSWSLYNDTYFVPNINSPYMRLLVNNTSVPSGTYPWEVHLEDVHGFSTRVVSGSLVISQNRYWYT